MLTGIFNRTETKEILYDYVAVAHEGVPIPCTAEIGNVTFQQTLLLPVGDGKHVFGTVLPEKCVKLPGCFLPAVLVSQGLDTVDLCKQLRVVVRTPDQLSEGEPGEGPDGLEQILPQRHASVISLRKVREKVGLEAPNRELFPVEHRLAVCSGRVVQEYAHLPIPNHPGQQATGCERVVDIAYKAAVFGNELRKRGFIDKEPGDGGEQCFQVHEYRNASIADPVFRVEVAAAQRVHEGASPAEAPVKKSGLRF